MYEGQGETPLITALLQHCAGNYAHLHVPAHRQGRAIFPEWRGSGGPDLLSLDLTELPGLDDLSCPRGVIARAQDLAAQLFGADRTFFLVNGSTVGLQALLLSLCRPGEEILLPRHAHRAVLGGLVLSGARPVFYHPAVIQEFGVPAGPDPGAVAELLAKYPRLKGVLVLHPTYYGITGDLERLVATAHRLDKPVVADEAHGTHFPFHRELPPPALACGTDATVQSMHKTGGSLTQSSLLHLAGRRVDAGRVAGALGLLQTSSPSYLLMASLDGARQQLAMRGEELLEQALSLAREAREELASLPGIRVLGPEHLAGPGACRLDPTRLVISVRRLGLTGYQAAYILAREYGVQVEMADYCNLVAVTGMGTTRRDCALLIRGLKEMARREGRAGRTPLPLPPPPPSTVGRLSPREAWTAPARPVPLDRCAGEISAEWVSISPPGIPLLYPGEEIAPETVEYLQWVKTLGAAVQGPADPGLETLRVVVG